ncbi:MAG: type II secretion system protein M [Gammaproteobacteria bacterium]|nr:type II secretion system protein M [Gammaproteobacteria bacterium]
MEAFLIETLNEAQRRWLALGLLILLIVIFIITVVWPLVAQSQANQETISNLTTRLQRYRKIAAGKNQVVEKLDVIKASQDQNNQFFKDQSYSLASADLQQLVKDAINQAGGVVTSTQDIAAKSEGQYEQVGIRVQLTANVAALKDLLYKVESTRPMLIIDSMRIRSSKGRYDRKLRKRVPTDQLTITLEVSGYMQHKGV